MKFNVEIDCTPEEARRFLGLPDVAPMQEAVMKRIERQMLDAAAALSPEALLRTWMPLAPAATPEGLQRTMADLFRAPFAPPPKRDEGGKPGS
jgi:Family of unknown function (DUF6489)